MRILMILAILLMSSAPAYAASSNELAASLKAAGRNPSLGAPAGLAGISYSEAIRVVDLLNQTDFRRLADAINAGRIDLPNNILSAIEQRYPRIRSQFNNR